MENHNKTLWIIAGANGSGKTTFVNKYAPKFKENLPFISPDDIAKKIDPSYDGKNAQLIQKAGRETIKIQNALLKEGASFGYETTFSSKRDLKMIDRAKELGYNIKLVYIGLNNPLVNTLRVKDRVNDGGHHVDPKDIQRRYYRSMENLSAALEKVNSVYIYDNSHTHHKMVARIKERTILKTINKIPNWVKENVPKLDKEISSTIEKHTKHKDAIKYIITNRTNDKSKDKGIER